MKMPRTIGRIMFVWYRNGGYYDGWPFMLNTTRRDLLKQAGFHLAVPGVLIHKAVRMDLA